MNAYFFFSFALIFSLAAQYLILRWALGWGVYMLEQRKDETRR